MSSARFDDALIAQARAGELRSSGKAQVDSKLLLSALERECALEQRIARLLTLVTHAARMDIAPDVLQRRARALLLAVRS